MSLNNLFKKRESYSLSSPEITSAFPNLFVTSKSGVSVTQDTAMRHTTVFSCYKVLSEGVAGMPLHLMKKTVKKGKTSKEKATNHKLYNVLHLKPNEEMTSFGWIEAQMLNLVSRGAAFSQILRNKRDEIIGFYPLLTDNMKTVRSESGELGYVYSSTKIGKVFLYSHEVLHTAGASLDGVNSISPIQENANSLGLSMAMEEFGSNFFANGANASGAFSTPGELGTEAYERLKKDLRGNYTGLLNSGKPLLLEGGLTFEKITIPNNDSQFLESRKYQRSEIASIFKVPLHMINDLEKSSFNNMEQQSLDFVIHTLRPWILRLEQTLNIALFGDNTDYYVKFNMSALLRGDTKTRYEAYGTGIRDGWLTRNEAREMEDLNPLDGLDEPVLPLNMTQGGNSAKTDED